jgi:uncharacterized membrane protein HdeD (DUF308 family)
MSGTTGAAPHGLGYAKIVSHWGWFAALGVAMIALGVFALGDVVAVTLISVLFIGAMLLVGGIVQVIHAFFTRNGWSMVVLNLVGGILYIIGGVLIMMEPAAGSVFITILLLVALVVGGGFRIAIAVQHRDLPGWWLLAIGGVISVLLGVMLYATLPWSGLWVLGTLIGIELIVQGVTWLQVGLTLRRLRRA